MNLDESLEFIRRTIRKYLPESDYKIFIYGSRASGEAGKWSDIDVGIEGKKKVPFDILATISEEIRESDIPYMVDVVDFNRVSEKFRRIARRNISEL